MRMQFTTRSLILWTAVVAVWIAAAIASGRSRGELRAQAVADAVFFVFVMLLLTVLGHYLLRRRPHAWGTAALAAGVVWF